MTAVEVALRQCSSSDAGTLALVGGATFLEAFAGRLPGDAILAHCQAHHTAAAYTTLLAQPATRAWLAEAAPAGAPIGYVMTTTPDLPAHLVQPLDVELKRIYLFSRFHGTGTARLLMEQAIAFASSTNAKRLLLGVHRENARALAFYHRSGFTPIGVRQFQVGPSLFDDLVLARAL